MYTKRDWDAIYLEVDDAQKHQLHVEDVLYFVRVLGQVDKLLEIGRIVLLAFTGHI